MSNIINTGDTLEEGRQKINNIYNNLLLWTAGTGSYSVVANNSTNNDSLGNYSVVGGNNSLSNGNYSFIYGQNLTGNGLSCFLTGKNILSNSGYNFIFGEENNSYGADNFIGGSGNTINSSEVFCIGQNNTVTTYGRFSFVQGFNSTSNAHGANIFGGYNNVNDATYSSIFCSPNSSLSSSASYSVILGGQNINGTSPNTVYVPYLNIKTINGSSSSSNVLTYNTSTKNVEKTNLPGSGFDSYRNWEILSTPIVTPLSVFPNKCYILKQVTSGPATYEIILPNNNVQIGDTIKILSFMPNFSDIKTNNTSDYIVLGGGYDYFNYAWYNDLGLVSGSNYNNFRLYKYETLELVCINNTSGNLKWVISNITTLQNFQKVDSTTNNYVSLLSDRLF